MIKKHHESMREYVTEYHNALENEGEEKKELAIYNLENAYYFSYDLLLEVQEQSAFISIMMDSEWFTDKEKLELDMISTIIYQKVQQYRELMDAKSRNLKGGDNV